jgi:hypothetical protein
LSPIEEALLLRDKTRPRCILPLTADVEADVVSWTLTTPMREATHWTAPAMAKLSGNSVSRYSASGAAASDDTGTRCFPAKNLESYSVGLGVRAKASDPPVDDRRERAIVSICGEEATWPALQRSHGRY